MPSHAAEGDGMDSLVDKSYYMAMDSRRLWNGSDNAASFTLDTMANFGKTFFNMQHSDGTFHRVQEGNQTNQLQFFAERYQKIGKYLYGYGKFLFDHGRTKERAWCDELRPYESSPFFSGSSIYGKYDFQYFDLTAAVGTVNFGGWRFGGRIDYKVGDFSRLRDPRSRSELLDYKFTPSLTYSSGAHTLGLSGYYQRRKEKVPNISTVQSDATIVYYTMSGLENADGTTSGYSGFMRQWVDHRFGATASWAIDMPRLRQLTELHIDRGEEKISGTYLYEPGRYYSYKYGIQSHTLLPRRHALHRLDLGLQYEQAYADEYRQQLTQTIDSLTGYTSYKYVNSIVFKKRYQLTVLDASMKYRYTALADNGKARAYAGVALDYHGAKTKRLLSLSTLEYGRLTPRIEGGYGWMGGRLWTELSFDYSISTRSDLALADATTEYAVGVLVPDQTYYEANYWRGHAAITYQLPLSIKKWPAAWFIKLYGDYLSTDNSLNKKEVGVTIGLFN